VEPGRKRALCREASAIVGTGTRTGTGLGLGSGSGVSDVAMGVRWRGWVRLSGHDPSQRREGWVGTLADGQVPVFFVHADVGRGNGWELKWEGEEGMGGRKIEWMTGEGVLNGQSKEGGVADWSCKGQ
jgi:hypothetical protein